MPNYWNQEERAANKETFKTVGYDPRFPNTNQFKRCYVNYIDYWRCAKTKGEDTPECESFKNVYKEICPTFWVENFDDQRANGIFPIREVNDIPAKF